MRLFNDALRVLTRLGNKQGMAAVLNNIAVLEAEQGLHGQAVETYKQVLQIDRELGDDRIAIALNNLGVAYWNSGDVENARATVRGEPGSLQADGLSRQHGARS